MPYDKPFKTFDEQLEILKNRGLSINDMEFAKIVLQDISYYTVVNGYKNYLIPDRSSDTFIPGTSFEMLYTLHILNINFSSVLLKYISYVENSVKCKLAYLVAKNYGVYTNYTDLKNIDPSDYLCRNNYINNKFRNNTLERIKKDIRGQQAGLSVNHYKSKNHIPPWIVTTSISLGETIHWYKILKPHLKDELLDYFNSLRCLNPLDKREFFIKSMDLCKEYRNTIAHGNKVFSETFKIELPKRQLQILSHNFMDGINIVHSSGRKGNVAIIFAILILLRNRYAISNFISDLDSVFSLYKDVDFNGKNILTLFSLPDDIIDRMVNMLPLII
ncbi:Abi family protein [Lachnoanaerobaculum sp. Marseille-Q4761]|uniref:Abi family protein n=1 Tax=Lachnoanaerobaculum sp. Marseille-Q4761 TaxID=2819511 RepID=UPI001AA0FA0D|nr:Abi family protein [Lachnoanaerobaculum sp. Marseille-Q4761]MBO1870116.1 Abi family protein [Lachnoanaerobaculum sp. Marseille-Q4761]